MSLKSFVWSSINKISMFSIFKTDYFQLWVLYTQKWLAHFSYRNTCGNYQNRTLINLEKRQYLPHYCSDRGFICTLVNLALPSWHQRSHEITVTVPLTGNPKLKIQKELNLCPTLILYPFIFATQYRKP